MGISRSTLLLLLLTLATAPLSVRCLDDDLELSGVEADEADSRALPDAGAADDPEGEDVSEDREKFLVKTEACYGDLGCFSITGKFFDAIMRPVVVVPDSPESIGTQFLLFTRQNPASAATLTYNDADSVLRSKFSSRRPTMLVVHGFLSQGVMPWMNDIRRAALKRQDCNVIQVGWEGGAVTAYNQAASNTRVVGAVVARMLAWLESRFGLSQGDVHLVGHSLGAQVSGYAGERLRAAGRPIARITGLDPAGPYFEGTDPIVRLDPTDAQFVDVIHTDAGYWSVGLPVLSGGFGTKSSIGHVDFFANGGHHQPGCGSISTCDHSRAPQLFEASLEQPDPAKFAAFPCDSYEKFTAGDCGARCPGGGCPSMGIMADLHRSSLTASSPPHPHYLLTSAAAPFFVVHYHVAMRLASDSPSGRVGKLSVQLVGAGGSKCGPAQLAGDRTLEPLSEQRGVFGCDWPAPDASPELQVSWTDQSFWGGVFSYRINVESAALTVMATGRVWNFCRFGGPFASEAWAPGQAC